MAGRNRNFFTGEKVWRYLTNFWTYIVFGFLIIDFAEKNRFDFLIGPMLVLYLGVLSLFVGTKEFDRWFDHHEDRHPGETYVILWTILMALLFILDVFLNGVYTLPSEVVATYLAVLGVFALTQRSKSLYRRKKRKSQ